MKPEYLIGFIGVAFIYGSILNFHIGIWQLSVYFMSIGIILCMITLGIAIFNQDDESTKFKKYENEAVK